MKFQDKTPTRPKPGHPQHARPGSKNRFHESLDALEDELFIARYILRQQLAACQASKAKDAPVPASSAYSAVPGGSHPNAVGAKQDVARDQDVIMADPHTVIEENDVSELPKNSLDRAKHSTKGSSSDKHVTSNIEPDATSRIASTTNLVPAPNKAATNEAPKTDNKPQSSDRPESPDMSFENMDFDAFLNTNDSNPDTTSADPATAPLPHNNNNNNNTHDQTPPHAFDFLTFNSQLHHPPSRFPTTPPPPFPPTAPDDNISALLPGLDAYANADSYGQAQGAVSAGFGFDPDALDDGAREGGGGGGERDTTFDDLFDIQDDFDMSGLGGEEEGE
ncbi:hypothetical protein LTR28_004100 [Elasticomyces elasticus]|nr:hypothetical protein LTR28_004100 [Elasticomyces elasticus]